MILSGPFISRNFLKRYPFFCSVGKIGNFSFIMLLAFLMFTPKMSYPFSKFSDDELTSGKSFDSRRLNWVAGAHIAGFTGSMLLLNEAWYKDHPRSSFHFHDDLFDWKQMDKGGHNLSGYHLSRFSHYSFRWAGLSNRQSALWGSISGNAFLATIEILDGFSNGWGASWSDMAANLAGSAGFYFQQIYWQEQKITWKYSFSESGLETYRPDLLGSNLAENMLKDYNGITYWLSFNIKALTGKNAGIPPWLNLAVGYGASGLLGSRTNPVIYHAHPLPYFERSRSFYMAPDIDYARIRVNSEILQSIFTALNFIKFPTPAIEYNTVNGFVFHWIFF